MELARQIEPVEEVIDSLVETLRSHHIRRMTKNECNIYSGLQFENMLTNMERISDQCSDLAVYMLGRNNTAISGNEHKYLQDLHQANDLDYQNAFRTGYDKYITRLNAIPMDPNETALM